ncbi:two pore domain potassium channel family protein [Candidatus Woesearchaeota archaeon]|nr:MAG: two pore domain potassium channel family protein [Candidatus Woesearchaeota archaeon]
MERTGFLMEKLSVALLLIATLLLGGMLFFHFIEGLSFVDAFYFVGITLTTVGYGDFVPTTPLSKVITVLFSFLGIGLVFYSMNVLARAAFEQQERRMRHLFEKHERRILSQAVEKTEEAVEKAETLFEKTESWAEKELKKAEAAKRSKK